MIDPLVMLLRDLQSAANRQRIQSPLTWKAINTELHGTAPFVSYDQFNARWNDPKDGPMLKQLVDRFDGRGLVVKTKAKDQPEQGQHKTGAMKKMAKRAAEKAFK